jgi:hypothetical protein
VKEFMSLVYLFLAVFILAYGAIRIDQAMGWEAKRVKITLYIGVYEKYTWII